VPHFLRLLQSVADGQEREALVLTKNQCDSEQQPFILVAFGRGQLRFAREYEIVAEASIVFPRLP